MIFLLAHAFTNDELAEFGLADKRTVCAADTVPACELFNGLVAGALGLGAAGR
jgi:hypothetical protein